MKKKIIPYGKHYIDNEDIKSVIKILKSYNLTQGPQIKKTENALAKYVGSKYAVLVSSCTAGLHISCKALGVTTKTISVTSPITFVSTANATEFCGGRNLFVDIMSDTISIDPQKLEKTLKKNKRIKHVLPVHFGGLASDMKSISKICKKYKVKIIEDAAHGFGGKYLTGERIGCCKYSDVAVFSFHPVKILAGGEGGLVTTNSKEIYYKLLEYRSHGIIKNMNEPFSNRKEGYSNGKKNIWYYEMKELGFHYRQTDIHSALILSQLKKINLFLNFRYKISKRYDNYFKNQKNVSLVQEKYRRFSSNHLYIIKINFNKLKINRNEFLNKLRKSNILAQIHYIPVPFHPYYKKYSNQISRIKKAVMYYRSCLSIPIYYGLKLNEQKFVMKKISDLINQYSK